LSQRLAELRLGVIRQMEEKPHCKTLAAMPER
jgi:hypothetical protein